MGSNYEMCIYNQFMEVMGCLDATEKACAVKKEHKEDVDWLNAWIDGMIF